MTINLAVTTRQCNPGDDFILNGIKKLFPEDDCWAIYNRNPDNKLSIGNHWTGHSLSVFSRLVIAGTPQWYGPSVQRLFEYVVKNPIPVCFLGIGVGESGELNLTELDLKVLRMAGVITTRGKKCKEILSKYDIDSKVMPCPAFFAGDVSESKLNCVGCVLSAKNTWKWKSGGDFTSQQIELYKKLNSDEVIVHHIDEIEFAQKYFKKVLYADDPKDYEKIYNKYSVIVSSRLHGAVYGMSLGKLSFLIDINSKRCQDVAPEFDPLIFCSPENVLNKINKMDMNNKFIEIIKFKNETKQKYESIISSFYES